ncbi:hypothetical protein [Candidatus Berkiella aquae]|uniref:Sel1 repeat protein n=1 Tax=Candidatus Berkiella aquae TaxID=295108 RepID=A0A0Q9YT38_9GAMM|nr:hypothetical protein [Candidatus Berkiella aquae]MCS5711359.1 hypothetical protein [Candidatus Berkiella aquae]
MYHRLRLTGLALLCACSMQNAFAFNVMKYSHNLATSESANEPSRATVLGIVESCGQVTNIDDDCLIQGLDRVANEENNLVAQGISKDYEDALNTGNFDSDPECQVETHLQANRIVGHCLLLAHYYALSERDHNSGLSQLELCLQGGLQGLADQGNMVALYMLSDLLEQKGIEDIANQWKKVKRLRKDSDEYHLLTKCYG